MHSRQQLMCSFRQWVMSLHAFTPGIYYYILRRILYPRTYVRTAATCFIAWCT
jgi:dolichyl-phosphate-mannose--protein O-mannosyl transferase